MRKATVIIGAVVALLALCLSALPASAVWDWQAPTTVQAPAYSTCTDCVMGNDNAWTTPQNNDSLDVNVIYEKP